MFKSHHEWRAFLSALPGVLRVSIEPLESLSPYAHPTLIRVERTPLAPQP
jgi:hypothetical protein